MAQEPVRIFFDELIASLDFDKLKEMMIPLYEEFYTADEINSLLVFYTTETGASYTRIQSLLDQEVGQFLVNYTQEELQNIVMAGEKAIREMERTESDVPDTGDAEVIRASSQSEKRSDIKELLLISGVQEICDASLEMLARYLSSYPPQKMYYRSHDIYELFMPGLDKDLIQDSIISMYDR